MGRRLRDEFANGRSYYSLHGSKLRFPGALGLRPANDALEWHRQNVFVG